MIHIPIRILEVAVVCRYIMVMIKYWQLQEEYDGGQAFMGGYFVGCLVMRSLDSTGQEF